MAFVLALFLPVFAPQAVDRVVLVAWNALLWLFLATLLAVFRMRPTNQYLVLEEDWEAGAETGGRGAARAGALPSHRLGVGRTLRLRGWPSEGAGGGGGARARILPADPLFSDVAQGWRAWRPRLRSWA